MEYIYIREILVTLEALASPPKEFRCWVFCMGLRLEGYRFDGSDAGKKVICEEC